MYARCRETMSRRPALVRVGLERFYDSRERHAPRLVSKAREAGNVRPGYSWVFFIWVFRIPRELAGSCLSWVILSSCW
jgi:hypothetical protein